MAIDVCLLLSVASTEIAFETKRSVPFAIELETSPVLSAVLVVATTPTSAPADPVASELAFAALEGIAIVASTERFPAVIESPLPPAEAVTVGESVALACENPTASKPASTPKTVALD